MENNTFESMNKDIQNQRNNYINKIESLTNFSSWCVSDWCDNVLKYSNSYDENLNNYFDILDSSPADAEDDIYFSYELTNGKIDIASVLI